MPSLPEWRVTLACGSDMEQWLTEFAQTGPMVAYLSIVGVLILTGFGLPVPEDVPIIVGGYLSGLGYANPWIMLPAIFLSIIGADAVVFVLGKRWGYLVPKLPLLRRFLTEKRLAKTERALHKHGGKFIFVARFLPGLRTAAIFTAGLFKMPYWKFLLFDGSAALISVPTIFILSYVFAEHIDQVRHRISEGQTAAIVIMVLAIVGFVAFKIAFRRKIAAA